MSAEQKKPENNDNKGFRSPPFPFISLPKAVERVKALHVEAQHHAVGMAVLAKAWNYSAKSSGLLQTAAALIQFGLLTDEGSGEKRRFQLTNEALRIVQDADPNSEKRKAALRTAALSPKIHKELWDGYGESVGDVVLVNYLMIDRREGGQSPFSKTSAEELINEYKASIAYAELEKSSSQIPDEQDINKGEKGENSKKTSDPKKEEASIGDLVEWESAGVLQFTEKRVRALSEDGKWAFVDGSETGIPMDELSIVKKGGGTPITPPRLPESDTFSKSAGFSKEMTSLDEGAATLIWPENLSEHSFYDLEHFLHGILQKAKRRAGIKDDKTH